jgi:hypothetical protein
MENNPYTPPAAEVADPPRVRLARPRAVNVALAILVANLVVQFISQLQSLQQIRFRVDNPWVLAIAGGEYLLMVVIIQQLAQGRSWPRAVLLIITLVAFALACYAVGALLRFDVEWSVVFAAPAFYLNRVLPLVAHFVALHLLYISAGDWFREQEGQRP